MFSDSDGFSVIVDLNIDDESLDLFTAIVSEDNGLCLVVNSVVEGGEDELGAALLALRWAEELKAERIVLHARVLELPAAALTVASAPVARHLEVGRVTMLKTQEVVSIVLVADHELRLRSHLGSGKGSNGSKGELFHHCLFGGFLFDCCFCFINLKKIRSFYRVPISMSMNTFNNFIHFSYRSSHFTYNYPN